APRYESFQQSSTHSAALPATSKSPKPFGLNDWTGVVFRWGASPQSSQLAFPLTTERPHQNDDSVPARAAYSHSASLGRRYFLPVFCDSHDKKSCASSQLTSMTGRFARPQPRSSGRYLQPPAATQRSHSSNVTSRRPIAKGLAITTRCVGFS